MRLATEIDLDHIGQRPVFGMPIAIWSMLLTAFVMSFGFFMLIPLVSVYYTESLGFTAAMVGLALAVRQFSQQGLMLVTGSLAERIGYRPVLAIGMLIRSAGFGLFVIATDLPRLLLASFVAALGGAFFEVSARSLMARLVPSNHRTHGFAMWSLASNVGLALGPLLGALLIRTSFAMVCVVAAAVYIVGATSTMLLIPPGIRSSIGIVRPPGLFKTIGIVTRDRTFVVFSIIMCGYYLLNTQLYITVPLETLRLTGTTNTLGLIYLVNSLVAIGLQFPLIKYASRRLGSLQIITSGVALLGVALLAIGLGGGLATILASVALLAVARVLVEPVMNTSVAGIASKAGDGLLASYFGFSALSVAIGGSAGQLLGGWLFDLASELGRHAIPWLAFGAIGAVVTASLALYSRSAGAARLEPELP
jgi:DHA1 family multidrug resistance protein-like MFS transporter